MNQCLIVPRASGLAVFVPSDRERRNQANQAGQALGSLGLGWPSAENSLESRVHEGSPA